VTSVAAAAGTARGPGAAQVARAYIAALDRHDGAAVCDLFAPQLRAYEEFWDGDGIHEQTCAQIVDAHFHDYYSRHRWQSARIRGRTISTFDPRTAVDAVRMTLVHHYICAPQSSPPEPCHPSSYRRTEIIYLIRARGRWRIIKPGLVYRASELDSPLDAESDFYPPGTPATVAGPASVPAATSSCPPGVSTVMPPHSLQSTFEPNPRGRPGNAPWLKLDGIAAARLTGDTICFTLTLGARPRPDSDYQIYVGTIQQQAAAELYDVQFDGLGQPHPLLAGIGPLSMPGIAGALPRVFLLGTQLQIIGTDPYFAKHSQFLLGAGTESLQSDEPLLKRPLNAGDQAPNGGCLTFPTGRLETKGLCGSTPGP
jgi:hypothetical protein